MTMPWFVGWVYEALGVSTCLPPPFCCCAILTVGGSLSETSVIPLSMSNLLPTVIKVMSCVTLSCWQTLGAFLVCAFQ